MRGTSDMCAFELKEGDRFFVISCGQHDHGYHTRKNNYPCWGRLFQYYGPKSSNWHSGWDVLAYCLRCGELYVMGDQNEVSLFEDLQCDGSGI